MTDIILDGKPVVVGSVLYVVNCPDELEVKEIDMGAYCPIKCYRKIGAFYRFTEGGELQNGLGRVLYWAPVAIVPPEPPVKKYQMFSTREEVQDRFSFEC